MQYKNFDLIKNLQIFHRYQNHRPFRRDFEDEILNFVRITPSLNMMINIELLTLDKKFYLYQNSVDSLGNNRKPIKGKHNF